jgi:hypothetical protein
MTPAETPDGRGLVFWALFWAPCVLGLGALLLYLFKEQLNELRTLRFLTNQLAPYFPEFDIEKLQRWVALCAPHVWHGQRRRDFSTLADFATPELLAGARARFEAEARRASDACSSTRSTSSTPAGGGSGAAVDDGAGAKRRPSV